MVGWSLVYTFLENMKWQKKLRFCFVVGLQFRKELLTFSGKKINQFSLRRRTFRKKTYRTWKERTIRLNISHFGLDWSMTENTIAYSFAKVMISNQIVRDLNGFAWCIYTSAFWNEALAQKARFIHHFRCLSILNLKWSMSSYERITLTQPFIEKNVFYSVKIGIAEKDLLKWLKQNRRHHWQTNLLLHNFTLASMQTNYSFRQYGCISLVYRTYYMQTK